MKKSKFSESQIVSVLKEAESGIKVDDLCRKHGISQRPTTIGNPGMVVWKPQN